MKSELKEDSGIDLQNFTPEEEIAKFKGIKPQGWTVLVRLYTKPKKTTNGLYIPDTVHDEQQYKNCTGLVVAKSKAAYQDPRYKETGHWCEVGDWVIFPRHAGYKIQYNGIPVFVLPEDAINVVTDFPEMVLR